MDKPLCLKPGHLTQMTIFGGMEPFMMVDAGDNMFDISDPDSVLKVCRSWRVNFPIFHFSFGMPEKLEAKNRRAREKIFGYLKERGIHPAAYVKFNGIFATSFFRRDLGGIPEAKEWIHKTPEGTWFSYWIYPERQMICLSHKGWLEQYLLDRAKKAVDAGAEAIFLDNLEAGALCYCENCKQGFRRYLKGKFCEDELKKLGVEDISELDPSDFVSPGFRTLEEFEGPFFSQMPWKDRLFQEWLFYQMKVVANSVNEFSRRIKEYAREKYGREVLIMPNFGGFGDPRMFAAKRINFELLQHDITWFEWDYPQTYAQLQFVKALTRGKPISSYGKDLLHLYGDIWHISGRDADPTFPCRWPEWRRGDKETRKQGDKTLCRGVVGSPSLPLSLSGRREEWWYDGYQPSAKTAVVCSLSTILFDEGFEAFEKVTETLCRRVPVEAVSLTQLTLGTYNALVLPGVTCLSAQEVEKIMGFAQGGGKVLASKGTGRFDEHAQPYQNRLQTLLASLAPKGRKTVGKGEVVCYATLDDLVEGVLSEVEHPVRVLQGKTDFVMTCRKGEELTVRIGGARDLMLEIGKGGKKSFPVFVAPSQEHLGGQALQPLYEDEERMVLALPNTEGFGILNLLDRKQEVSLSLSPAFQWIASSKGSSSVRVMLSNPSGLSPSGRSLTEEEKRFQLRAEVFESCEPGWRMDFRRGDKRVSEVVLSPKSYGELELLITVPHKGVELFPIILVKAVDPASGTELNRAAVKLQRSVAAFDKYSLAQVGPDDEQNLDRTGLGVVLFNRREAIACRTATVKSHRGSSGRELLEDQLLPRNGVITGFVPDVYPWPRGQRPRFIRPFVGFSPGLGSYLVSDRIYDQNRPEGGLNFSSKIVEDTLDSVAVLFEFDQPPFHIRQTIRATSALPGFQITYQMQALEDGLVYSWYLPRFGIPEGAKISVGTPQGIRTFEAKVGELPLPEEGWIKFHLQEKGRVLTLELGSLEVYGGFRRKSPFLTSSNLSFESPILCIPVTHRSALEVRKGDEYRVEFFLSLSEVDVKRRKGD